MDSIREHLYDDYSLKIYDIIIEKKKKYIEFEDLCNTDKCEIIRGLKRKYGKDFRFIIIQGFDVLKSKFFIREYVIDDSTVCIVDNEYDTFDEYYRYLSGNIYDKACYYGYDFSDDEISKYSLDINKINKFSYSMENIDNYSFEKIVENYYEGIVDIQKKNDKINEYIDNNCLIKNYTDLKRVAKKFETRFGNYALPRFFFPKLIQKKDDIINKAIIKYCYDDEYGFSFIDALFEFGEDSGRDIIKNYIGRNGRSQHSKNRFRRMKDMLECYCNNKINYKLNGCFEKDTQLYCLKYTYYDEMNKPILMRNKFVSSFSKLFVETNGDLSGFDLSYSPIEKGEIEKCIVNDDTILPLKQGYSKYTIEKCFRSNRFIISQEWYNDKNKLILNHVSKYRFFCDFAYFLNGDLSNANFLMFDDASSLRNVKNIDITGIKVKSETAKELNLKLNYLHEYGDFSLKEDNSKFEIESANYYAAERIIDDYFMRRVSYITDIHLMHIIKNNKCLTEEDADYTINMVAKEIAKDATSINLIGGDISSDIYILHKFVSCLRREDSKNKYFVTLGNHELWDFASKDIGDIVHNYREYYKQNNIYLVHNNLYYIVGDSVLYDDSIREITADELESIDPIELKKRLRMASLIIFGGLGFAGKNDLFNANAGIYRETLNREEEIKESDKFYSLYNKVADNLFDKNVIIFTHNPKIDWAGNNDCIDGFIYVNGHRHRNYFYDDGIKRVYADNQVGYYQKNVRLKKILVNIDFDYFSYYENGIYEITRDDYETFYRGIQKPIMVNKDFNKIYMLKRDGNYMFLAETKSGKLSILYGAAPRNSEGHSLNYYYENLTNYSNSIKLFLSKYENFQKNLSNEIKKMGGDGKIHGCIVDIDYFNHIYINPLDGKITPYFAYSMTEKYVYKNLISLLKNRCYDYYINYKNMIENNTIKNDIIPISNDLEIVDKSVFSSDTQMYRVSRIIKALQYTTKYNIVRLWNDSIIGESSEEKGKLIVDSIINPPALDKPKK